MVKKVILDSSFILSAVREKIDIFEEIPFMGYIIVIPEEVFAEIKHVKNSKQKLKERENAELALKIMEVNRFESIKLGQSYVDNGLREFCKNHRDYIVATLDRALKKDISNYIMVIRGKKTLEVL